MDERLKQQLDFILEIDKEKNIFRQTTLTNHGRRENDAEHAWHMAIMIYLLKEYANFEFDVAKAMLMALIHDVVEIDAGDTYAYDETALATQAEREAKAAIRLFGLLPEDQGSTLKALFEEYEAGTSSPPSVSSPAISKCFFCFRMGCEGIGRCLSWAASAASSFNSMTGISSTSRLSPLALRKM